MFAAELWPACMKISWRISASRPRLLVNVSVSSWMALEWLKCILRKHNRQILSTRLVLLNNVLTRRGNLFYWSHDDLIRIEKQTLLKWTKFTVGDIFPRQLKLRDSTELAEYHNLAHRGSRPWKLFYSLITICIVYCKWSNRQYYFSFE